MIFILILSQFHIPLLPAQGQRECIKRCLFYTLYVFASFRLREW